MALSDAVVETRLPAKDLDRARVWYAEKLGLEAVDERPGGLRYRCGPTVFCLFASRGASEGSFTQLAFEVDDIEAEVAELRARGVEFEEYDFPGFRTVNGIIDLDDNYPSRGAGERGAFFRDSEGNMLSLGQPVGASTPASAVPALRGTSVLLGSADPLSLRGFYERVFGREPVEGWLQLGSIGLLVDGRDDVATRTAEPGRVLLTFDTDDAKTLADRLRAAGAPVVSELEEREDGLFCTFEDPDGNYVQVIQLNESYFARIGAREI
ncbi:VOC family protein [Amycolatopsis sp. lyj-108]|uniref:VOC family protein n=1 Tax=Amycolatopsis sp. lyj-108 TaxID=2789286 RepID=UPI00397A7AD9